jgi:ribosomal protein S18 acetylase RimI-like enzyme
MPPILTVLAKASYFGDVDQLAISLATDSDRHWSARLMAESDPWRRLGHGYGECLTACQPHHDTVLFIARDGDKPCGFALLRERGVVGSPYLASIGVDEAYRGRGIGSRLLAHAEAHFQPRARHMFLCVSSFNHDARRLYERLGYARVGELPDYIIDGASEILMHKRLDRS